MLQLTLTGSAEWEKASSVMKGTLLLTYLLLRSASAEDPRAVDKDPQQRLVGGSAASFTFGIRIEGKTFG